MDYNGDKWPQVQEEIIQLIVYDILNNKLTVKCINDTGHLEDLV